MRRRLITICVCLLLGAIVNVAVAWGCGLCLKSGQIAISLHGGSEVGHEVELHVIRHLGLLSGFRTSGQIVAYRGLARTYHSGHVVFTVPGDFGRRPTTAKFDIWDDGWPCRALRGERWQGSDVFAQNGQLGIRSLALVDQSVFTSRGSLGLNCQLLWPGFAINTVFYAAVLWLLLIGPARLRRFIRRRRGLCPACAYPVGSSDLCTECGKPVSRRPET